jgi:hypothetical protein
MRWITDLGNLSDGRKIALGVLAFLALQAGFISLVNSQWNKDATTRMYARLEQQCAAKNGGIKCPPATGENAGNAALVFEMAN